MAEILPFRAIRPKSRFAGAVVAPPYDAVGIKEAQVIIHKNPLSFLRVLKPEATVAFFHNIPEIVYSEAEKELHDFINKEIFFRDKKPAFYIYTERTHGHRQSGIVGLFPCKGFESGEVRGSEDTRAKELEDRVRWIKSTRVESGPVFLFYREKKSISEFSQKVLKRVPEYDFFTEDGVRHTVHIIKNANEIALIKKEFLKIKTLYIADGNHRARAACKICGKNGYFLAAAVPHTEVQVFSYNRIVNFPKGKSAEAFAKKFVEEMGGKTLKRARAPRVKGEVVLITKSKVVSVMLGGENGVPDALLAEKKIMRTLPEGTKIGYIGGKTKATKIAKTIRSGEFDLAVLLFPPSPAEIMRVADSGKLLPPKSTWFYPKFRSGLFLNPINEDFRLKTETAFPQDDDFGVWY